MRDMVNYNSQAEYLDAAKRRALLPAGFSAASVSFSFTPVERPLGGQKEMNLSLIMLDRPTDRFAATFTRNRFPGAPVLLGKSRLDEEAVSGVVINNKVANVCAPGGLDTAERICQALGALLGQEGRRFFSSSTGVIGWSLPLEELTSALPGLTARREANRVREEKDPGSSLFEVARGIMTTDAFPKVRSAVLGGGRITAVVKGAGMIEPNMATMLCFIMTDLDISRKALRRILPEAVDRSFNAISVDGDQSTSDMVLAFSSAEKGPVSAPAFADALTELLRDLAEDLVRNGEGTEHVIRLAVSGAPDHRTAREAGKGVVNSPLVKTAVAGNDPNVGRILSSLGDWAGNNGVDLDPERVTLSMGGRTLFQDGRFTLDQDTEDFLAAYLREARLPAESPGYPVHPRCVDISLDLGLGSGTAEVLGSDLTHGYVSENADYRT